MQKHRQPFRYILNTKADDVRKVCRHIYRITVAPAGGSYGDLEGSYFSGFQRMGVNSLDAESVQSLKSLEKLGFVGRSITDGYL